ncbi:hydantoinase/oxoprolinase family protein [Tabrizicola sp.]|uniref:hydantoinase/oxoprolinase family protein n=1 Tax=Tabrizicola sp. TaxID=2005166 RepID=UPI003F334749
MSWIIGVDVGGTFTDFFAFREVDGATRKWKRPSTPSNPAEAIIAGLKELCMAHDIPLAEVDRLCHGSTVATNALIQRRGADCALITTKGLRDVIEIGRQTRPVVDSHEIDSPPPLIPRKHRYELGERLLSTGEVLSSVPEDELAALIETIRAEGLQAVAVCFLFAYVNPAHEERVGAALRAALPGVSVSLSSEVQPEFREFERFTTTVVNAYLQPRLEHYIETLINDLSETIPAAQVGINQSSGGLMSLNVARAFPVRMALSGPAAGVVGAIEVAKSAKAPEVITIDIGGTSADVALIRDYRVELSAGRDVDGFPVQLPMVDVTTVGAGGGSIAWFAADGLFKVGPQSAGAVPGPACYRRGGTLPTVSDANLLLGRLSTKLLDGGMTLDLELAKQAIATVAEPMNKSLEETALGILQIMTVNMVRAIRSLSVERGHDPRRFALMPFGGAGGLHAREVAAALGMATVLVPPSPGILCAQGLTDADLQESFVISRIMALSTENRQEIEAVIDQLTKKAQIWFKAERAVSERQSIVYSIDLRFRGQNFELLVEVGTAGSDGKPVLKSTDVILERFFEAHERAYGFADKSAPVEAVNFLAMAKASLGVQRPGASELVDGAVAAPVGHREVTFSTAGPERTPIYHRDHLAPGTVFYGPAIVDQMDSTTIVFPGDEVRIDGFGNMIITLGQSND